MHEAGAKGIDGDQAGSQRFFRTPLLTSFAMLIALVLCGLLGAPRSGAAWDAPPAGAEEVYQPAVAARDWQSIVLHHSATAAGDVASIDAAHRMRKDSDGRPWLGIGYHFVVGNGQPMGDGEVQPTFRWKQQLPGAHAGRREENERGIGICLIGDFETVPPTARQLESLNSLLKTLTARYGIRAERVVRHSDLKATRCPGRLFPWEQVLAELPKGQGP
jgi:hypothetical protein